jgi:hypothetical protein
MVIATGSRVAPCGALCPWAFPTPCSGRFSLCMNPDSHTAKTKRMAAKSIAAIPAESIPFIGEAVLIADTGYELYAACETVRDLDQLYSELGMADEVPGDAMHSVCDPELAAAVGVWGGVVENMDQWWGAWWGCVAEHSTIWFVATIGAL